jgi:hypothetical protein
MNASACSIAVENTKITVPTKHYKYLQESQSTSFQLFRDLVPVAVVFLKHPL